MSCNPEPIRPAQEDETGIDIDEYRGKCVICKRNCWANLCTKCDESLCKKYGELPEWADQMRKWQHTADHRHWVDKEIEPVSMEVVKECQNGSLIFTQRLNRWE